MHLLYPNNIKKYTGIINQMKNGYKVKITTENLKVKSKFPEYDAAVLFLIQTNIMNDLLIKNVVEIRDGVYFMRITKDQSVMIDKSEFKRLDKHIWHAKQQINGSFYVRGIVKGKLMYMHNFLMRHQPTEITVDHIDRNCLNNCLNNLRLATKSEQSLNQKENFFTKPRKDNLMQILNLHVKGQNKTIFVELSKEKKRFKKSFSIKKYGYDQAVQKAILFRDKIKSL